MGRVASQKRSWLVDINANVVVVLPLNHLGTAVNAFNRRRVSIQNGRFLKANLGFCNVIELFLK